MNALIQELMMSSCQYFTNDFKGNIHSANTINPPNITNTSLQESDNDAWINTTNKWDNSNIYTYTTSKWIIMAPSAERKNKGKAPVQDYSQNKRLPAGQPFKMHEGASSGVKPSGSTSLQGDVLAEVTYSNGDMIIALQEVLSGNLQFHNGIYSELPDSIKLILDNLQFAFTRNHHDVFQKTLHALEIHLVNLTAQNEAYASHYANLISEKTLASEDELVSSFVPENIIVSENATFRSHLVNCPNVTNEPYISQLFGK